MNKLIENIPGDAPFGIYLKGDRATYRALRNAFNVAQAAWRNRSETPETLLNDDLATTNATAWAALSEACKTCLCETSKDLEILSWYIAAQLHGPQPMLRTAQALDAMAHLVENSIADLQPSPPEAKLKGDSETARTAEIAELRLRPFLQLFGEVEGTGLIIQPMTNLALIGEVTHGRCLLAEKDGTFDALRTEVAEHLAAEGDSLTQKIEALQSMETTIGRIDAAVKRYANAAGQTPPMIGYGTRLVVDVLQKCQLLLEGTGFVWPGAADAAAEAQPDAVPEMTPQAPAAVAPRPGNTQFSVPAPVSNRNEALAAIAELAKYFRQSEPHSPICLLLDRAVRWGGCSVGELYREVLSEGSVGMSQMALMTGLESQGFADSFGRRGAPGGQNIEHPTLDNYAAALPVPASQPQHHPAVAAPASTPAPQAAAPAPRPAETSLTDPPESEAAEQPAEDIPMDSFQW